MNFYLIGIKGTGMSHLASWLAENGHSVSGEDVPEDFYTSALLKNIPVFEPGSALPDGTDAVVYSTSYEKCQSFRREITAKRIDIVFRWNRYASVAG